MPSGNSCGDTLGQPSLVVGRLLTRLTWVEQPHDRASAAGMGISSVFQSVRALLNHLKFSMADLYDFMAGHKF